MTTIRRLPMMLPCVMTAGLIAATLCGHAVAEETKQPAGDAPFFELLRPSPLDSAEKSGKFLPAIIVAKDGSVLLF